MNAHPIIIGTDFSEPARRAANAAVALAIRLKVPLLLAHARGNLIEGSTPDAYEALTASLLHHLESEAKRLRDLGATVEETLAIGDADDVLVQLARERQARLLIVSSLGHSAPARWLVGSVAERTAEAAPVPTLVVREAAPFEAWARGERPLRILVGTDFTASSDAALRWITELRQVGPCEVVAAYADWPPDEAARFGLAQSYAEFRNSPEMQELLERDVREKVFGVLGRENVTARVCASWGRPDALLIELAIEARADLVVAGTHQRHGLSRFRQSSISRGLLHVAPMNVACVPASDGVPTAGPRIRTCRRVLVAVDLNEPHGFATPYAYSIVDPGGTVHLVHDIVPRLAPNPMLGGSYRVPPTQKEHSKLVADARERLLALAPAEAAERGITTEVEITESREIAAGICAAAERFDADILCIGSHTRPGFAAKVLGSVSLAVLQKSRRPVLIVWPPTE